MSAPPHGELTEVEHLIGMLLRQGMSNKEIGSIIGYSPGHVRNRLTRMMTKVQVENRVQLAIALERTEWEARTRLRVERQLARCD